MRILLVEDERGVANFVTYVVDVTDTDEQALELVKTLSYGAIILDSRLPEINGIEVCPELKGRGIAAPVLMLSEVSLRKRWIAAKRTSFATTLCADGNRGTFSAGSVKPFCK